MVYDENKSIGAYAWVTLTIFVLAIVPVIRPFKIPLGKRSRRSSTTTTTTTRKVKRWYIYLNLATGPPLAVLILLVCGATNMTVIKNGLVGSLGIQPYSILILFYSLAYICVSLDMTGIFQFLAFWVSKRAGSRGRLAFTLFFVLTSLMSGLTSNDVVILTGTAFLAYFTRVSGILPTAFMMSEFTSANIASMALFIGNPTNVVVSTAYEISFLEYSAWMLLPTLGGLAMAYVALRVVYWKEEYLPRHIPPPDADIDPQSFLIDRQGAYFGIGILVACLLTLIGTSFVHGVEVWMVTLPFAVISIVRDLLFDLRVQRRQQQQQQQRRPSSTSATTTSTTIPVSRLVLPVIHRDAVLTSGLDSMEISAADHDKKSDEDEDENTMDLGISEAQHTDDIELSGMATMERDSNNDSDNDNGANASRTRRFRNKIQPLTMWWQQKSTSMVTLVVWLRLPWTILPFSLGMFVLVEILSDVGWTGTFASALVVVTTANYMAAVVGMMLVTILLCQLLNNLPTTILLTRIIQHEVFASHAQDPAVKQGVLLGLIAGSNLGACLTLVGSLAGIMFEHILKTKGIYTLGYFQFVKWNLLLLPSIFIVVAGILMLELYVIFNK